MKASYYHTKESIEEYIQLAKNVSGMEVIAELLKFLPRDSRLLEIGSGPGTDFKILSEYYKVVGSDYSQEFLNHLYAKYPSESFLELDAITMNIDQKFDGIYSNKVLQHLTDEELKTSIINQTKILNPGAIICHSFWKGEGSEEFKGMFVNYHEENELRDFFESAFEILDISEYKEFKDGDSILVIARNNEINMMEGRNKLDKLEWGESRIEELEKNEYYKKVGLK